MPATYAHYNFGNKVCSKVNEYVEEIILNQRELFNIGIHGPDILFYYKPLIKNEINELGYYIHFQRADKFFIKSKEVLRNTRYKEECMAYILGFICHFMLDSECHGYIENRVKNTKVSHTEIESEFDKKLIKDEGKDPFNIDLTAHMKNEKKYAKIIAPFFDIDDDKIEKSIDSMKHYCSMFNGIGDMKKSIIMAGLKLTNNYEDMYGVFFNRDNNILCEESNVKLEELLEGAILPTANIMNDFYLTYNSHSISDRFNRNFE